MTENNERTPADEEVLKSWMEEGIVVYAQKVEVERGIDRKLVVRISSDIGQLFVLADKVRIITADMEEND